MPIDPLSSAMDALVSYLTSNVSLSALPAALQTLTVRRGWPEHGVELDLSAGPTLAVHHPEGNPTREEHHYPVRVDASGSGTLTALYRVSTWETSLYLECWAPYRATLDATVQAVDAVLDSGLPHYSGLRLTQANYYSRPLKLTPQGWRYDPSNPSVGRGEWRATCQLRAIGDRVRSTTHPELVNLDAKLTTQQGLTGSSAIETVDVADAP